MDFKDIETLFTGAHEQNYPICIFHLVQGHDFVITRKKRKYAYLIFIFNLFFRNLNVLSKAKPILKTLQVCLLYSKKEYRAAKTRVILVVRLNEVPQFCRIFATVFSMSIIAFRLCFIVCMYKSVST